MTRIATPAALRAQVEDTLRLVGRELDGTDSCALLLFALAELRAEVAREGGYRAMRQFDDWLLDNLLRRRLRRLAFGGAAEVPLPSAIGRVRVPQRARLMLKNVLEAAAASARASQAPALLLVAADALVDALVEAVGGVPGFDPLLRILDRHIAAEGEPAGISESEVRLQ